MSARVRTIFFLFAFAALVIIGRLFFLQVMRTDYYAERALSQQSVDTEIEPKRGTIYLRASATEEKFVPVALTKRAWSIWISPKDVPVDKKENLPAALAEILGIDQAVITERLAKENDPYEPLKDGVDEKILSRVQALNVKGVGWSEIDTRYYPLAELAAHTVGFVSRASDGAGGGQYGLEEFYDDVLAGRSGRVKGVRNPFGFLVRSLSSLTKPEEGANLYLTIDYNIQAVVERELLRVSQELRTSSVSAVVLDPQSGEVLAIASTPAFDPNTYNTVENISRFIHPITQKLFEPGSIFKPITMAVGLDINVVAPGLTYYDKGFVQVGNARIKNSTGKSYGTQTMTQVLEKSLNTGAVFVVQKIPKGVWREYIEKFGLGEKTGIDLSSEAKGDTKNIRSGREVEQATSSFGQGIAVTPIELVSAISAIANGGDLIKPYVVQKIVRDGEILFEKTDPEIIRKVVRTEVAETVSRMMVSVVENGSGRYAQIPGYSVAGKTGTAQVPGPEGGYSERAIHSFVGFAPAFDPRFAIIVKIDDPHGSQFSEATAAPLFRKIAEFILHYYGIEPDKPLSS